jgi:hypothetical protein
LALNNTASMNKRSPRTARGPVRWGGRTRGRRAHCLSPSAWRCTPVFHHVLLEVAKNTAIPSSRQGVDLAGAKLGARAAGSAPDGTCAGAPRALRADASRSPRKSWTRTARPLTSVPEGGVPAQARGSRAPLSLVAPFPPRELGTAPRTAWCRGIPRATQCRKGRSVRRDQRARNRGSRTQSRPTSPPRPRWPGLLRRPDFCGP